MIWLTWRPFRIQAVTATAALAAFAVLLVVTGPHLASQYSASGVADCHGSSGCANLASAFLQQLGSGSYWLVYLVSIVIILVTPAIIGIFWGAPLIAREFETGFQNNTQGAFTIVAGALSGQPGAWIISNGAVDAAGQPTHTVPAACVQAMTSSEGSGLDCLASHGIRVAVSYQPLSCYWAFEWTETAIYFA